MVGDDYVTTKTYSLMKLLQMLKHILIAPLLITRSGVCCEYKLSDLL